MTELSPLNQIIDNALQRFLQSLPPVEANFDFNRWQHRMEEINRQSAEDFPKMKEEIARLDKERKDFRKRMVHSERAGFYRMLNCIVRDENSPVYPIPLPNGGYPAKGTFPKTLGDFLSLDAHALTGLLELYELPREDQVVDARKALARHLHLVVVST